MSRHLLLVFLAGLFPGRMTHAQSGAPDTSPPPDIQRVALHIRPEVATRRLEVTATVDIANPGRDITFEFLLADWYDTVRVLSRAGPAAITRDEGVVTVRVARPDTAERLVFELSGAPGQSGGDDRSVLADSSIYLLWSDRFYPADFDDWAIMAIEIEVRRGFRALAPGRRVSADDRGAAVSSATAPRFPAVCRSRPGAAAGSTRCSRVTTVPAESTAPTTACTAGATTGSTDWETGT